MERGVGSVLSYVTGFMRPKARASDPSQGDHLAPWNTMGAVNSEARVTALP